MTDASAPSPSHAAECIDVSETLARVGDKWSMVLVLLLRGGTLRFGELKRRVPGISQRMLTLTLRGLEREGLVQRTLHPAVPPKVEYQLTALGRSLSHPIEALGAWAKEHEAEVRAAREAYDARDPGSA